MEYLQTVLFVDHCSVIKAEQTVTLSRCIPVAGLSNTTIASLPCLFYQRLSTSGYHKTMPSSAILTSRTNLRYDLQLLYVYSSNDTHHRNSFSVLYHPRNRITEMNQIPRAHHHSSEQPTSRSRPQSSTLRTTSSARVPSDFENLIPVSKIKAQKPSLKVLRAANPPPKESPLRRK